MTNETPREIWEGRRDILRKAKDGNLTFGEFAMLDMHKETKNLLSKKKTKEMGSLSEEGLAILLAIESYLDMS